MGGSDVSSLRLVLAGAWWALRGPGPDGCGPCGRGPDGRGLSGRGWGRLLTLFELAVGVAPGLLKEPLRDRLGLGLKAQIVASLLRDGSPAPDVLDALDWLFPEGVELQPGQTYSVLRGSPLVAVAGESFRDQVLGILGSGRGLHRFLQDYGQLFREVLGKAFLEFLRRVESALPPPDLAQLEELCLSHAPPGPRPNLRPILCLYLLEVGRAPSEPVSRPLPDQPT